MDIDYTQVKKELLVAIRGRLPQVKVKNKLGYKHNYISRWESNLRDISWVNFVKFCVACGKKEKLQEALSLLEIPSDMPPTDFGKIITLLKGKRRISEFALLTGFTRFTINRWMQNKSSPSLEEMLIVIDKTTDNNIQFVSCFANIKGQIPSLKAEYDKCLVRRNVFCDYPLSAIIDNYLEHCDYKEMQSYQPGSIARRFGFSPEEEELIVCLLKEANILEMKGGKIQPHHSQERRKNIGGDYRQGLKFQRYWLKQTVEFFNYLMTVNKRANDSRFFCSSMCLSVGDLEKIKEKCRQHFDDVRTMPRDEGREKMVMLNVQLLNLDEMAAAQLFSNK